MLDQHRQRLHVGEEAAAANDETPDPNDEAFEDGADDQALPF